MVGKMQRLSADRVMTLMYHRLLPFEIGEPGAGSTVGKPAGNDPYLLPESVFATHVQAITASGSITPRSWDDLGRPCDAAQVWITFDDGHQSDLDAALPILKQSGLCGMFFITTDWIGRGGYMSEQGLRRLTNEGMLVGAHGRSHRYLSSLDENGVREELLLSKARLEDVLGCEVPAMALPGGRNHPSVRRLARELGYRFVFTSRIAVGHIADDPLELPRIPITRGLPSSFVAELLAGDERLLRRMARSASFRELARHLLGDAAYVRLRRLLLSDGV